jgi:hypothetical protein
MTILTSPEARRFVGSLGSVRQVNERGWSHRLVCLRLWHRHLVEYR